jgi:hypothetical protein
VDIDRVLYGVPPQWQRVVLPLGLYPLEGDSDTIILSYAKRRVELKRNISDTREDFGTSTLTRRRVMFYHYLGGS